MSSTSPEADVNAALDDLEKRDVIGRLWRRDHTLWKPSPSEISNRLGWLDVTDEMAGRLPELQSLAAEIKEAGYKYVVLLGMGGSSLGAEVLRQTFGSSPGYPQLLVLDSTVPAAINAVAEVIDRQHTLFLVASKSGTTMEPLDLLAYFIDLMIAGAGEKGGRNFVAITDPGTPLAKMAEDEGFRRLFLNFPDIGGRYSVLSGFGLVPAVLLGIDTKMLLERAERMRQRCLPPVAVAENPAARLGVFIGTMAQCGRDKLTLVTSPCLDSFGLWVEQLIAESLGKEGKGIVPVVGEPLVDTASYGGDRAFVYLRLDDDDNTIGDGFMEAIRSSGQPVLTLELADRYDIGGEFYRWELATAVTGAILGVNPFDQPDVQRAKEATGRVLEAYEANGSLPPAAAGGYLKDLLSGAGEGPYLAIMAYLHQTETTDRLLAELRCRVINRCKIATTSGYGPRYLHSTGQLHKGGPDTGLFLLLTARHRPELPVPGKPYDFGTVADAQALGDLEALKSLGRRVAHVHLGTDVETALARLVAEAG